MRRRPCCSASQDKYNFSRSRYAKLPDLPLQQIRSREVPRLTPYPPQNAAGRRCVCVSVCVPVCVIFCVEWVGADRTRTTYTCRPPQERALQRESISAG